MDQESYDALLTRQDHPADCYVRPGEYLHHMYRGAIKYLVAPALPAALAEAAQRHDYEALAHLRLHEARLREFMSTAGPAGTVDPTRAAGTLEPSGVPAQAAPAPFVPAAPEAWEQTGMNRGFLVDMILRTLY
jgi:hypothetical protein